MNIGLAVLGGLLGSGDVAGPLLTFIGIVSNHALLAGVFGVVWGFCWTITAVIWADAQ
jgi:hypothetical protein